MLIYDEFRCGAPASATDPDTGEVTQTRSEWLTHLVDLGSGGSLGLAQGRTAEAEKDLLAGHAGRLRYAESPTQAIRPVVSAPAQAR